MAILIGMCGWVPRETSTARVSQPRVSSPNAYDDRRRGIPRGASDEEAVAPALLLELLDRLDDEPHPGRRLGMAVDERGAVVVERLDLEPHLAGEVEVVHGERVVGLHDLHLVDLDSRLRERRARGGDRRLRHEPL